MQKGWALKENQIYGNMGGGVRMSKKVISLLQYFFQAGNAHRNDRYTAAEMLAALQEKVISQEITAAEVPKESTIARWIGRYAAACKVAMADIHLQKTQENN